MVREHRKSTWQKLRSKLRNLWVPEIRNDLDIHIARYRKSGGFDDLAGVAFVYKKEEIYTMSDSDPCGSPREVTDYFYPLSNRYVSEFNVLDVFQSKHLCCMRSTE